MASEIDEIVDSVSTLLELAGARVEHTGGYPGWKPNLNSPLLKTAITTFKSLFGKEPDVKAVHAGLECGIIGEKFPGIDMVSFGRSRFRRQARRSMDAFSSPQSPRRIRAP
ncbi:MAG TPA: hypothetical protein VMT89_16345 [Candidatus Acidoferrales bacterium]|nr:hypothetical protein [Candidatus Acidoferrales bacterium]